MRLPPLSISAAGFLNDGASGDGGSVFRPFNLDQKKRLGIPSRLMVKERFLQSNCDGGAPPKPEQSIQRLQRMRKAQELH